MNAPCTLLTTALLLTGASSVFAASSVDLTVKGLITPSACTPSLSSGGVIDHGKISAKDLKPDSTTPLDIHTLQMEITCNGATLLALKGTDNQGSKSDYSLGMVDGKKLGKFALQLINATADGAAITPLVSSNNGLTWMDLLSDEEWPPSYLASFGDRSTGNWAPSPVMHVSVDLPVHTHIYATAGMDLTKDIPLNGSATIEVKYL